MSTNSEVAKKIEALNAAAMEAFKRKDAAALAEGFTGDGEFLGAHQPIAIGRAAIAAAWEALLALPNVSASWRTREVRVAESGDLAFELGTYALAFDGDRGRIEDVGKYIVIWRNEQGVWKIAADIINSDLPMT